MMTTEDTNFRKEDTVPSIRDELCRFIRLNEEEWGASVCADSAFSYFGTAR